MSLEYAASSEPRFANLCQIVVLRGQYRKKNAILPTILELLEDLQRLVLRDQGLGFGVWGLGFQAWGLGLRVWGLGLGFRVLGSWFGVWVWSLGFGVEGSGLRA